MSEKTITDQDPRLPPTGAPGIRQQSWSSEQGLQWEDKPSLQSLMCQAVKHIIAMQHNQFSFEGMYRRRKKLTSGKVSHS